MRLLSIIVNVSLQQISGSKLKKDRGNSQGKQNWTSCFWNNFLSQLWWGSGFIGRTLLYVKLFHCMNLDCVCVTFCNGRRAQNINLHSWPILSVCLEGHSMPTHPEFRTFPSSCHGFSYMLQSCNLQIPWTQWKTGSIAITQIETLEVNVVQISTCDMKPLNVIWPVKSTKSYSTNSN